MFFSGFLSMGVRRPQRALDQKRVTTETDAVVTSVKNKNRFSLVLDALIIAHTVAKFILVQNFETQLINILALVFLISYIPIYKIITQARYRKNTRRKIMKQMWLCDIHKTPQSITQFLF